MGPGSSDVKSQPQGEHLLPSCAPTQGTPLVAEQSGSLTEEEATEAQKGSCQWLLDQETQFRHSQGPQSLVARRAHGTTPSEASRGPNSPAFTFGLLYLPPEAHTGYVGGKGEAVPSYLEGAQEFCLFIFHPLFKIN